MSKFITDSIEISSGYSDEEESDDFDKEDSDEENYVEETLTKKIKHRFFFQKYKKPFRFGAGYKVPFTIISEIFVFRALQVHP